MSGRKVWTFALNNLKQKDESVHIKYEVLPTFGGIRYATYEELAKSLASTATAVSLISTISTTWTTAIVVAAIIILVRLIIITSAAVSAADIST